MARTMAFAVCLLMSSSLASIAMPIPGKLVVMGQEFTEAVVYFTEGTTENVTPASLPFYNGDISPDGMEVAYIGDASETLVHLWKAGVDGSTPANLTAPAGLTGVNCQPSWSLEGA